MSETQLMSLRMPVELVKRLDAIAEAERRSRAQVIIRAIEVGLVPEGEPVQVAVRAREPEREVANKRLDPAASEKLRPCDRCDGPTIEWGPQRRCMKCCINYTR